MCARALCLVLFFATLWTVACQTPLSTGFSRQENWSGLSFSAPGTIPTQGSNPRLLHWWADSPPLPRPCSGGSHNSLSQWRMRHTALLVLTHPWLPLDHRMETSLDAAYKGLRSWFGLIPRCRASCAPSTQAQSQQRSIHSGAHGCPLPTGPPFLPRATDSTVERLVPSSLPPPHPHLPPWHSMMAHFVKHDTYFKASLKYHPSSESLCSPPRQN